MDGPNGDASRLSGNDSHDLRDALAVTKGWLEVVFRKWSELSEEERFQCVAGALLGANQMVFRLERLDGVQIDLRDDGPELRMAEEFWKLAEQNRG